MKQLIRDLMTKRFIVRANGSLATTLAKLAARYQRFVVVLNGYDPVTNKVIHFDYPVNRRHNLNAVADYISAQAIELRNRGIIC